MIETVTSLLFGGDGAVVYECRRCGTTVDGTVMACPNCGNDDIVTHTTR